MPSSPFPRCLLLLCALLTAACGSSSGTTSTPIEVSAPALAAGEGTVEDGGGIFDLPPVVTMGEFQRPLKRATGART